jgi:hypothetical protein
MRRIEWSMKLMVPEHRFLEGKGERCRTTNNKKDFISNAAL